MDVDSQPGQQIGIKPENRSLKLSNGASVHIGDYDVLFDVRGDPRLEGCCERVKSRRLEWLAARNVDLFRGLLEEVLLLLPTSDLASEGPPSVRIYVGKLKSSELVPAARTVALKYFFDRVGLLSRLLENGRVELFNSQSNASVMLPRTLSRDSAEEWLALGETARFFDDLDREHVPVESFSLEKRIYKGNVSSIYECQFRGAPCAAKVINMDELDPAKQRSCWHELCLLREVGSLPPGKGIIKYFGYHFGSSRPRQLVILMERATESLSASVARLPFTPKEMLLALRYILKGLQFLHESNIVHRDLKLANCLLVRSESGGLADVFLADFGLARKRSAESPWIKRQAGSTRWMAPEVLAGKESDWRSDVWSLGMTIVEMVNRKPPYQNIMVLDVPDHIGKEELPTVNWAEIGSQEAHSSELAQLKEIVTRCLKFDPELRPSASELLSLLHCP